jgi:hypothetical protein
MWDELAMKHGRSLPDHSKVGIYLPTVPDRAEEYLWAGLTVFGIVTTFALALYILIELEWLDGALSLIPMAIFSCLLLWPAVRARKKRLVAAAELERYRIGVRKAASEI